MTKDPKKPDDRPDEMVKPKNWLESLNCAIEGIIYAFKTQRHMKYHCAIAVAALVLSLFLRITSIEFVVFAMAVIILLFAEMVNTAIEETVNLVEEKHHIIARNAKDVSAGAVLISSVGVAIMVYVIFFKYIDEPAAGALTEARDYAVHLAVIALLIVLICVVASKAVLARGRPFHGGMPSGHSAVAFSLWTAVSLITLEPIIVILTFVMALMVSHSRLIGGIHTRLEVFLGALLGTGLTLLIFKIFSATLK
jgi:diacylglycerol kinase (ATP)